MPAVITQATEHVNTTPRAGYCDVEDVRLVLRGVEVDDAGADLGAWLSAEKADETIEYYIKRKVHGKIKALAGGRDFELHTDVDVVVDGAESDVLRLGEFGFTPLVDVTELSILGTVQDLDDFIWYQDGRVAVAETYSTTFVRPHLSRPFPAGRQNVALTITWGYEVPPDEIRDAAASFAAVEVLKHIGRSGTQSAGMLGGIQKVEFDDFKVTNYGRSRYGAAIEEFTREATAAVRRFKETMVTSLVPNDRASSLNARADLFGRGRTDLG